MIQATQSEQISKQAGRTERFPAADSTRLDSVVAGEQKRVIPRIRKVNLLLRSQHNNIQRTVFLSALWAVFFSGSWSSSPKGNANFLWIKGDGWKRSFCDVSHNEGKEIS